jgi:hypothetical protein
MERRRKSKPLAEIGRFTPVPHRVTKSHAYRQLSHPAARLLWDIAGQYTGDDNGRLLASWRHMKEHCGWSSKDTLHRALASLMQSGFVFQTVMGHRPNKASWFAVTWFPLAKLQRYDPMAERGFVRWAFEINSLSPSPVLGRPLIGPSPVPMQPPIGTPPGPMEALLPPLPSPSPVHPLEMPSMGVQLEGVSIAHDDRAMAGEVVDGPGIAAPVMVTMDDVQDVAIVDDVRRERDGEQDPSCYDPDSGEFIRPVVKTKQVKAAASAWVGQELRRRAA